jgi:hypothetical protein
MIRHRRESNRDCELNLSSIPATAADETRSSGADASSRGSASKRQCFFKIDENHFVEE